MAEPTSRPTHWTDTPRLDHTAALECSDCGRLRERGARLDPDGRDHWRTCEGCGARASHRVTCVSPTPAEAAARLAALHLDTCGVVVDTDVRGSAVHMWTTPDGFGFSNLWSAYRGHVLDAWSLDVIHEDHRHWRDEAALFFALRIDGVDRDDPQRGHARPDLDADSGEFLPVEELSAAVSRLRRLAHRSD
jgi:hypothetical protein